jgi:hypothetical protein
MVNMVNNCVVHANVVWCMVNINYELVNDITCFKASDRMQLILSDQVINFSNDNSDDNKVKVKLSLCIIN